MRGDAPILLLCREVAEALGSNQHQVSNWRRLAIADGYLKQVAPHRFQQGQPGAATAFRFIDAEHLAALIAATA